MDYTALTNDELAGHARALVDELHVRQAALPASAFKTGVGRRLGIVHRAMDVLKEQLVAGGIIRPMSGGEPKPDEGT